MIRQIVQQWVNEDFEMYSKVCKVTAVNGLVCDVQPIDDSAAIKDVRLTANPDGADYCAVIPVVNSFVIVTWLTKDVAFVSLTDAFDKVIIKKGEVTLKTALTKLIEAVQQIVVVQGNNPNYVKLQQAQTEINQLLG